MPHYCGHLFPPSEAFPKWHSDLPGPDSYIRKGKNTVLGCRGFVDMGSLPLKPLLVTLVCLSTQFLIYGKGKTSEWGAAVLWTWVHSLRSLLQLHCHLPVPNSLHVGRARLSNNSNIACRGFVDVCSLPSKPFAGYSLTCQIPIPYM
jgi:hypothetical protein